MPCFNQRGPATILSMGSGDGLWIRFSVASFLLVALMQATTPAMAQSPNELDRQRAARQAQAEWRRVLPAELACIDQRLRGKGSSIEALARRGVKPSAAWLTELRSSCRDFVGRVQTDNAPSLGGHANGSPTETISESYSNEPKTADATSTEMPKTSDVISTAESSKNSVVTSSRESPKELRAKLASEESIERAAVQMVQQGDHPQPKNIFSERGIMELLSVAFLFALAAIAVLLGNVIYLLFRWLTTGDSTAAVPLLDKDSDGAGDAPLETTIPEAPNLVGPSADKEIERPNQKGRSAAAQPTYGELFPKIVSVKSRNSL
jgi:Tfp pilus assembly protein PilX